MSGNSRGSGSVSSPSTRVDSSPANGQDHADTQRSLQQASIALEVAYNRIRQVRHSLLQLSESFPNPEEPQGSNMNYNDVSPGHEALLLSGGDDANAERSRRGVRLVPPTEPPTSGFGNPTGPAYPSPSTQVFSEPSALFQPATRPSRQHVRREFNPTELSFTRRRNNQESASTTRGLRVAARETSSQDSGIDFSTHSAPMDRLSARQRAVEGAVNTNRAERQDQILRYSERQRATPTPELSAIPPISATPWRAPDPRRWRVRTEVRASALDFSLEALEARDRFQSISNMLNPTPPSQPLPTSVSRSPPVRSSLLSRNTTDQYPEALLSDDMGSNVNIDWSDEEFISWLFPAQDHYLPPFPIFIPRPNDQQNVDPIRITRTTDTALSPPENSPPRRGWARLDPDGNEISYNEEEELERSRTEYRLRALQRARQNATAVAAGNTRPGYPIEHDSNGQRTMYGSVLDSTMNIQEGRQRSAFAHTYHGDSTSFYVDPLPMPLASMLNTPRNWKQHNTSVDIFVPKHACLAGR